MSEYFYMFSDGSYSDYCVGGLYRSGVKYTEEDFVKILKQDLLEQMPSAYEYLVTLPLDLAVLSGNYGMLENLYVFMTQDRPVARETHAETTERSKRKQEWHKNNPLDNSLSSVLIKKGIIEEVEYDEIHNDN